MLLRCQARCASQQEQHRQHSPHPLQTRQVLRKPSRGRSALMAGIQELRQGELEGDISRPDDLTSVSALAADAVVWASQHGLVYGLSDAARPAALVHAPVALFPVTFPRGPFQRAAALQRLLNRLMDRVAQDRQYLHATLAEAAKYDDFTARLLRLDREGGRGAQAEAELVLGIHRSDYMLHEPDSTLLQVEFNTVAASFGCLASLVSGLHRHVLQRAQRAAAEVDPQGALPDNPAITAAADALAAAVRAAGVPGATVIMAVQPGEQNSFDQQWVQTRLWEPHKIHTFRKTLAEIGQQCRVDEEGRLWLGKSPVGVVYFRAGYTPKDYPSEREWDARLLLERSRAVLCPNAAYQLAGSKKVQQDLAQREVLRRFLDAEEEVDSVSSCFAGLWSLDSLEDPATKAVLEDAAAHPDNYVLKPQREGGGNNLYGAELRERLSRKEGLAAYILMQRIKPPVNKAVLLRGGEVLEAETLSEVGIYGTFLRRGANVLLNEQVGHLVRTKAATSNEGGVAAGFAVLDSPYLV